MADAETDGADLGGLQRLLGGALSIEHFLDQYYDKQSLVLRREAILDGSSGDHPSLPSHILTLDELDELLVRVLLPGSPSELLIFENLRFTSDYATPHIAYASGASLILNKVDKCLPSAHALCSSLALGLRYAYANLYLTPPDSQTVPPHSDDHDVFIIQLHGRKHWRVWPTAHPLSVRRPFADEQAGKDGRHPSAQLTAASLGEPEIDTMLEAGDVLYIPRGVIHVADTSGADAAAAVASGSAAIEPSLHLTVAIPTADLSVSSTILCAVRTACFGARPFRRGLPLGPFPGACGGESAASCKAEGTRDEDATLATAAWHREFEERWQEAHAAVTPALMVKTTSRRLAVQREKQQRAYKRSNEAYERAIASGDCVALRHGTRLVKAVPMELRLPSAEWPLTDLRRVAQSVPLPGASMRPAFIHTPPELHKPLAAFEAWPVGTVFALEELPARDDFLRACAARSLCGLGVAQLVAPSS